MISQRFNYVTGTCEPESLSTDEIARQYISQGPAAQGMYDTYRAMGLSILKASANVLSICIGQDAPYPVEETDNELSDLPETR